MNIFLTTLMHPKTSSDYYKYQKTFEITAKSICSQTDPSFLFLVVCNEIPEIAFKSNKIIYITVDADPIIAKKDNELKRLDKATKLAYGLRIAKDFSPSFVYICDADDWINKNVNKYLSTNFNSLGFVASKGLIVNLDTMSYSLKYGLQRYCGSTFALNYQALLESMPGIEHIKKPFNAESIVKNLGRDFLINLFDSHSYDVFFNEAYSGKKMAFFPFPAVCWVRGTGNNLLENSFPRFYRSIDNYVINHFSINLPATTQYKHSPLANMLFYCSALKSSIGSLVLKRAKSFK